MLWSAAASAEGSAWFRTGPYLQRPAPGTVEIRWEGRRARDAEVRLEGREDVRRVKAAPRQAIRLDDLEPGERYGYEVRTDDAVARGEIRTAPPPEGTISFAVMGNTRSDARVQALLAASLRTEDPDFLLGTGNLVSDGLSAHEWTRFFDLGREVLASAPIFPAIGTNDRQGERRSADHFDGFFSLPGEPGDESVSRHYAFSYGPARIVVLDSTTDAAGIEAQTSWLENELSEARADEAARHIFVATHHAPLSVGLGGGDERVRNAWMPLFEEFEVDAVFSGHDHAYARAESGGVRYFVTGGGGAPLYSRSSDPDEKSAETTAHFESVHHYLRVDVAAGLAQVTARRLDGTLIESVRWGENEPPGPDLAAAMDRFSEPPPAGAPPADDLAVTDESEVPKGPLRLEFLGLALAVVGGGVFAWSLRRGGATAP